VARRRDTYPDLNARYCNNIGNSIEISLLVLSII
jgi:hypothetical protein